MPCGVSADLIEVLGNGSVKVSGTFTGTQEFEVSVTILTLNKLAVLNTTNHTWSVIFSGADITGDLPEFRRVSCGNTAKYFVRMVGAPTCQGDDQAPVQCESPQGCPEVGITITPGECVAGRRTVHFRAEVNSANDATYTWFFGTDEDNQPGEDSQAGDGNGDFWLPAPNSSGIRVIEADHVYDPTSDQPQTITVTLVTSTGPNAECAAEQTFTLGPCPDECPVDQLTLVVEDSNGTNLTPQVENGECLPPGRYVVRAIVAPVGVTAAFAWRVDGFAAAVGTNDVVAINGARLTVDLTAFRSVSVLAAGCATDGIDLRPCEIPCCPDLDGLGATCMPRCPRSTTVTLTASGSDLECAEVFAWEFGDGTSSETATATETHPYPSLGRFDASVTIVRPRECGRPRIQRSTVVVVPCPPSCFCVFLAIASALLLLSFLVLMPLIACIVDPTINQVLIIAMIVVVILLTICMLWWLLDPCCKPTRCEFLRILFWVFSWTLVIVSVLLFFGCVSAIPFGIPYAIAQQIVLRMINDQGCNPGAPDIFSWPFAPCR